ncbi:helix-turn-helix domain-containing protein [Natronomonas marina]|uniref:helix-turn-helix domain-containing protein n=1 Tax=Natronomonas marina TaxID=2961939 RepID=UPI0020C93B85|nr:helix-turn-helix domain-containing protein [Natronomonas marina]
MRYATVVISPNGGGLQPTDESLTADPTVTRDAIHQINLLSDDTCVTLYSVRGNLDRAAAILDDQSDVIAHDVSGDREGLAYIHFRPTETVARLLSIVGDNEIVLKTPIDCLDDGGVRVTLVGDDETIQRVVDSIPDSLRLSLEGIGDYHPDSEQLFSVLTERQQEILEAAVELGYYEEPRQATHEEIARTVDVSAGTVGEHLRKVEGKVLASLVQ